MVALRVLAWLLIAAAAFAAGHDALLWLETGDFDPIPLGQVWANVDRDSLLLVEPALVRHVHPFLWEWIAFPLLQSSAALIACVTGALLAILVPKPKRRRRSGEWR
jgi:membrane associated rhomboid family serine protease